MSPTTLDCPQKCSAYPGEYIPLPITLLDILDEFQQPQEGEANPLVNIEEHADALIIEMAAPGLNNSDFNVSITGNVLSISCLHKDGECSKKTYRQHEFNFRCFKKDIVMPENTDTYFISAAYANGILRVSLPKSISPFKYRSEMIVVY